jgi:sterol desaturase/sphingolipid hydroxylase (fatty acid hydroxylase superfamily)
VIDRVFGTLHMPAGRWPSAYGIEGNPVPEAYWRQLTYPFRKEPGHASALPRT